MDQPTYDAIVVGMGGMGSATAWQLAKRGARVLGLEQFEPGHDRGASHGDTRLIRKGYFEHPDYVPLLHRAYQLWDELEAKSGYDLFHRTGLILAGNPATSQVIAGVKKAAREHRLDIDELSLAQARELFPQFQFNDDWQILFEKDAGFLRVEACVNAHVELAIKNGAKILYNTKVNGWKASVNDSGHGPVTVQTSAGEFRCERLIVTSGPWAPKILNSLGLNLSLRRVVQHWFSAPSNLNENAGMPCFGFDTSDGFFYGMPAQGGMGLKAASHSHGSPFSDADQLDRSEADPDLSHLQGFLGRHLKGMTQAQSIRAKPCIYTMSADEHFIIDAWPAGASVGAGAPGALASSAKSQQIFFAAGFSGHGFKFASVVGELLTDLALTGAGRVPFGFLQMRPGIQK